MTEDELAKIIDNFIDQHDWEGYGIGYAIIEKMKIIKWDHRNPCPLCGFHIVQKERQPFIFDKDE